MHCVSGGSTLCVYLDLGKAFDTISDIKIIEVLNDAGVSDSLLSWFHSYLSDRQQFVVVNGASLEPTAISSGVPRDLSWARYFLF